MKTMQEMKKKACAAAWHWDRRADFRAISTGFSQEDIGVSGLDHREGAF